MNPEDLAQLQLVRHFGEISRLLVSNPMLQPLATELAKFAILNPRAEDAAEIYSFAPGKQQVIEIVDQDTGNVCTSLAGLPLPYELAGIPLLTETGPVKVSPMVMTDRDVERYASDDHSVMIRRICFGDEARGISGVLAVVKQVNEHIDQLEAENAAFHAELAERLREIQGSEGFRGDEDAQSESDG
jgi:hypothetical protein